jgi:urease accessory protein
MLVAREILGAAGEERWAGRLVDDLRVDAAEAGRRRLRRHTRGGLDVAVDLPHGSFLADGAVLADDGQRIVVVRRPAEPALVVRLDLALPPAELVAQAARLGHALGNQHVPIEVEGGELRVHVTTTAEIAAETVERLGLRGAEIFAAVLPLARHEPPSMAHGH